MRTRFTAVLRRRYSGPRRVLLVDVRNPETGAQVTDHLWFNEGKWSSRIRPRYTIAFDARVVPYLKGRGPAKFLDYRLERPTQVQVLSRHPRSPRNSSRPNRNARRLLIPQPSPRSEPEALPLSHCHSERQ